MSSASHEVWELIRSGEEASLSEPTVERALTRIVEREDPAYTQLWTSLTRNQKRALKAVISTGGVSLLSAETTREFELPASSMSSAVRTLEERHIVRLDTGRGARRYRLVDPFLAHWLAWAQELRDGA